MSTLLSKTLLAAALGLSFGIAGHAADTYNYPAEYEAARAKCDSLKDSALARCIVNIRSTPSADGTGTAASDANSVKNAAEQDEAQALKQCEQMTGENKQHCIDMVKEHKSRM